MQLNLLDVTLTSPSKENIQLNLLGVTLTSPFLFLFFYFYIYNLTHIVTVGE